MGLSVRAVLEFLDVPTAVTWELAPEEALDFLTAKGLAASFDYRDLIGAEHARAFTVAKMMDTDLLADVKASLDDAIAKGVPFRQWADGITPLLQAKGWWGRQQVTDPLTGETVLAALGSPSRLQTIYRTNMQSAYAAGAWDAIEANKDLAPFLLYDAVDDFRTRPEHAAWDGTVLEVGHDWWATHYPPNGWNCRCSVIQLSEDELADLGLGPTAAPEGGTVAWTNPRTGKTRQVPKGVDPGWDYNVGAERAKALAKALADKVAGYPAGQFRAAASKGLAAAAKAGEAVGDLAHVAKATKSAAAAAMQAETRAAQAAIAQALKANTPHLAKAIQAVQATKAGQGMGPAELLKAAQVKAAKAEQSAHLAHWKQATLAGKTPGPKAQAAFDALPEEAGAALKAQTQAQAAELAAAKAAEAAEAAAQKAAFLDVQAMQAKSSGTLEAKAAAKAILAAPDGSKWTDILAAAQADVAAAKASQATGQLKAATVKNITAGKALTEKQVAYLASLDQAGLDEVADLVAKQQAKVLADTPPPVASASPAAQTVSAPSALNPDKLVQIGPQRGSNPGGLFRDTDTGETWYIKTPDSLEHARNEVLAARLYQLAGADVPELRLTALNGKPAVASRIVDDLVKADGKALAKTAGAREHFAVDAWLANWDVAGATFDNLLVKGGKAFRVDTGGALRFRAQGGAKGAAWGDTVAELDSLRNKATNGQTAAIFGGMTREELQDSARRLLKIDRAKVDALVDQFGPGDLVERQALKATLRARLDDIARQLDLEPAPPVAAPPAPDLRPGGQHVTAADFDRITESRGNGYTISTDGGDIEDHQVLLQHYTGADGKARTRLVAKLRGEGAARALRELGAKAGTAQGLAADLGPLRDKVLALAKSINSRAAKGGTWDETIATRLRDFKEARADARNLLKDARDDIGVDVTAELRAIDQVTEQVAAWESANAVGKQVLAIPHIDLAKLADVKRAPRQATAGAMDWTRARRFDYQVAAFDRAHMRETGEAQALPLVSDVLEGQTDGIRVRFITDTDANSISSRGLVHIDVDGADLAAAERAMAGLAQLGVATTRTSQGQRLGLYLDKLANLRGLKDAKVRTKWAKLDAMPDEAARNAAKLAELNRLVGYDLTKSPHWNPDGVYQAFGHGRTLQLRPDLDGADFAAFERDTVVYTNVTGLGVGAGSGQWDRLLSAIDGGGILSSQMERARRGIRSQGSSVGSDHQTGGANYVFTRLLAAGSRSPGVYFKPRILRRVDAFSYDGDRFGNVSEATQRKHRAIDVDGFTRNRGNHGNETNFRDGISLFDDLERIIFTSAAEAARAIKDMKARGYRTWPDGRPLEDVLQGPTR